MMEDRPGTEMPNLRRRRSIHRDDESNIQSEDSREEEEIPRQCKKCHKYFLKSERRAQKKLSEEEVRTWLALKTSDIYPDLSKIHSEVCNDCGFTPECSLPDRTDSVGRSPGSIITIFLIGLIPLIAIAVAAPTAYEYWRYREIPFKVNLHEPSAREEYFDESLYSIEQKYPYQEDKVWYTLGAGIKFVPKNEPNRPSVFMFLYDSESAGNTAKCLAQDVSNLASTFLKRNVQTRPVILTGLELNDDRLIEDPGRMLVDYNQTLRDNGAMVVTNLQDVRPEVAKILHFFCDAYSPLVETAVFIFTLKVDNIPKFKRSDTARNKLIELWSNEMPDGTVEALITRVTPNVIGITSDTADC